MTTAGFTVLGLLSGLNLGQTHDVLAFVLDNAISTVIFLLQ